MDTTEKQLSRVIIDLKRIRLPLSKRLTRLDELCSLFDALTHFPISFEARLDAFLRIGFDKGIKYDPDIKPGDKQVLCDIFKSLKSLYHKTVSSYSLADLIKVIERNLFAETKYEEFVKRAERLQNVRLFPLAYQRALRAETNSYFGNYENVRVKVYFFIKLCLFLRESNAILQLVIGWAKSKSHEDFLRMTVNLFEDLIRAFEGKEVLLDSGLTLANDIIDFTLEQEFPHVTLAGKYERLRRFRFASNKDNIFAKRCTEIVKNKVRQLCQHHGRSLDKLAQQQNVYQLLSWSLAPIEYQSYVLSLLPMIRVPSQLLTSTEFTEADVLPRLYQAILTVSHKELRYELITKLARNRPHAYIEKVCLPELFGDSNRLIGLQLTSCKVLPSDLIPARQIFLESSNKKEKKYAIRTLAKIPCADSVEVICQALQDETLFVQTLKALQYSKISGTKLAEILFRYLEPYKDGDILNLLIKVILHQPRETVLSLALRSRNTICLTILGRLRIGDMRATDRSEFENLPNAEKLAHYDKIFQDRRIETHLEASIEILAAREALWKIGRVMAKKEFLLTIDNLRYPESEDEKNQKKKKATEIATDIMEKNESLNRNWLSRIIWTVEARLGKHDRFYLRLKPELTKPMHLWQFWYFAHALVYIYGTVTQEHQKEIKRFLMSYVKKTNWDSDARETKDVLRLLNEWINGDAKTLTELVNFVERR